MLDEVMPGLGQDWEAAYKDAPADCVHLQMHRGHLMDINDIDRPFVTGELLTGLGLAGDRGFWREKFAELEEQGATEIAFQPAGDIPRELEAMADVVFGAQ